MSELVIQLPGGALDLLRGHVLRHGKPVKIEPRAWRVLETLARLRHRVVTKEELLTALRPEGTVSEEALRLNATQERLLAIVPLPDGKPGAAVGDQNLGCPLEVLGCTLAVHARLKRMSAAEVQAGVDAAAEATPDAIAGAIGARSPGAHVVFARLARRNETLTLDYVLASPMVRTAGSMHDRSPAALGRRLAAKLLGLQADTAQASGHAAEDGAWMTQMLDLASRAAEEQRWGDADHILDVVLDQDPNHELAADLKARIATRASAPLL